MMTKSCVQKILQNQHIKSPGTSNVFNKYEAPKVDIQKSIIFLCFSNEEFLNDIKKTILVMIAKEKKILKDKFNKTGTRLVNYKIQLHC